MGLQNHRRKSQRCGAPSKVSTHMSVVIGGGSGFVGTALVQVFKKNGLKTRIITRKSGLPDSMTWDELSKKGLPEDAEYVISLAGANLADLSKKWEASYKKEVFNSRIGTTKELAAAIVKSKPLKIKAFFQTSAVGFYPPSESAEYTEDSPGGDQTDVFTELCGSWEAAGKLPPELDVRRVTAVPIFRGLGQKWNGITFLGVVLGRQGGFIKNIYWPFFMGLGGPVGSGLQWFPWIHIDDFVGLSIHLLRDNEACGIFNAVAPQPCTNGHFAATFARALKRPALFGTPKWLVDILFDKDRAKLVLDGQKVLPKRTLEFGYRFKYPDIVAACHALATSR